MFFNFFLLIFGAVWMWTYWYGPLLKVTRLGASRTMRVVLGVVPGACLLVLWSVLRRWSAEDVRSDPEYLALYLALGLGWILAGGFVTVFLGVSFRDDALERRNWGACVVVASALLAVTFCYAGGNVGNGPGPEAVVFSAGLSTGAFFLLWLLLETFSKPSPAELIGIERDLGAGVRLGGWLLAEGLLLGWSVTGDWVSYSDTLRDFLRFAWPSAILLVVGLLVERMLGTKRPGRMWGSATLAAAYVVASALYLASRIKRG